MQLNPNPDGIPRRYSEEPTIRVGLITDGAPRFEGDTLSNLLIGEDFHWQRSQPARFEGEIEMLPEPQGRIHAINILPIERYLEAVVGSEMNPNAPIEFLKAHAVISRSWAMRKIAHCDHSLSAGKISEAEELISWDESDSHEGFHVCSDDHCQRYQGIPAEGASRSIEAVSSTRGEVIADKEGNPADARFSKCCGGRTEVFSTCWADTELPYLQSISCPWCDLSDMEPSRRDNLLRNALKDYDRTTEFHTWHHRITKSEIRRNLLAKFGRDIGSIEELLPIEPGASGRLKKLLIRGSRGRLILGKELAIRRLLSDSHLFSSWIEISDEGEDVGITGRGWGHGAGLCQIGAARMAAEGKDYREILRFYYPETNIIPLYD